MSRKGVITKRVKTVQTALSRISAQPRSPAGRGTMFRARPKPYVRLKSRPKSKPLGRSRTTRETCPAVGQAKRPRHTAHDQSARAGNKPRGRATHLAYHGRCIRPSRGRTSHVRPRISSANLHPLRPRRPTANPSDPDRSDSAHDPTVRPIVPTTVPTPRSTRSPFEAQTYVFKPGLTLSRL
ncbi:unnamed protein product [Microthlaspi erraticum]|uniref:Uncharacterized protein n=1 Tax=Microthlaspi erraticum TaxID=1685480 RepID=A0A6D2J2N0_9BRAS|nr:unnamed protein product [Microthlaspi erraticum]